MFIVRIRTYLGIESGPSNFLVGPMLVLPGLSAIA